MRAVGRCRVTNLIMVTSSVPIAVVPPDVVVPIVARADGGSLCILISLLRQRCRNSRMEVTSVRSVDWNTWAHGISNDARRLGRCAGRRGDALDVYFAVALSR